jgi:uncharacterized protein (DUF983 family)
MQAMPTAKRPPVTFRVISSMIFRALTLRCPHCGSRGVLASWFRLKERCPRCKLHLHREENDYFLGAYVIMLITVELLFAVGFLVVLIVTWPDPPWAAIQWVGVVLLIASVLLAYPFAKTLWLAIDLLFRPVSSSELGWYSGEDAPPGEDSRR